MKSPKYDSFKPSSELASRTKQKNKYRDTTAELKLRQHVWKLGLRYRVYVKNLPGKPDMVFPSLKVAVFCDGDFWHGRNWETLKKQLVNRRNADYWIPKIKYNIERDTIQTKQLRDMGWCVLRFWESDIKNSPEECARKVLDVYLREKSFRSKT